MRTLASSFVAFLLLPSLAAGYNFSDWATDVGYLSGQAMPWRVNASFHPPSPPYPPPIESLDGIDEYNWTWTPTIELYLNDNQITEIDSGAFSTLTELRTLSLYGNQITTVATGGLSGLANLHTLDLHANRLPSIPADVFDDVPTLSILNLYENQITDIDVHAFDSLPNLSELRLRDNQLSSIPVGAFGGLSQLTYLDLHRNQLTVVAPELFDDLTNLKTLALLHNQLTQFTSRHLRSLTQLATLRLDDNQLTDIEPGMFSTLSSLNELGISYNQISRLEANAFDGLAQVEILWAQSNQTSFIDREAFAPLTSMWLLFLGNNPLPHFETGTFGHQTNLEALLMPDNPLVTHLNLAGADFTSLENIDLTANDNLVSVSLRDAVLGPLALQAIVDGGHSSWLGIGELGGITNLDLSGIDFVNITDLSPLYLMDDLSTLWLVGAKNIDPFQLDQMLDELQTFDSPDIEGVLYMTRAEYDAYNSAGAGLLEEWHNETGHHVEFVIAEPTTLWLGACGAGLVLFFNKLVAVPFMVDEIVDQNSAARTE